MQQQDPLLGKTLGNCTILSPLGQGGMARVYKARQDNLDREVAIKVLPPWFAADRNFVERFNLEARLVANLSHPNIVTVHDANEQAGHLYIVMQLVDGGTLKQILDQLILQGRTLDAVEASRIFTQLASALSYAHENGIIHRDVKPVNVLMDRAGRPILSDFGIAKVLAGTKELTRQGAGVGTPEYMSPEQCQGGPVDARADIYALGVMMFETFTGRLPFSADNYPALAHSHIYDPPPHPSAVNPSIDPAIAQVILTALMKNPLHRYQKASDMAEALERAVRSLPTNNGYRGIPVTPPVASFPPMQQVPQVPPMAPVAPPSAPFPSIQLSPAVGPPLVQPMSPDTNIPSPMDILYTCPRCQNVNTGQQKFCTTCGFQLNQCPACSWHNAASNRFCTRCRQQLRV